MRKRRADDQLTRRRLIEAGTRQFAAQGYKHVTIRGISREARANVAAVNYHFRDKLGLYKEVLESAFGVIRETMAKAIAAGEGGSAEDKLRAYIRIHCEAILATTGPSALQQLIHREMQEPTPGVGDLVSKLFKPRFEYLFGLVSELLGLPRDDPRVTLCGLSTHGLIVMFRPNPLIEKVRAELGFAFSVQQVTEHLLQFSLAGLESYREKADRRPRVAGRGARVASRGSRAAGRASRAAERR